MGRERERSWSWPFSIFGLSLRCMSWPKNIVINWISNDFFLILLLRRSRHERNIVQHERVRCRLSSRGRSPQCPKDGKGVRLSERCAHTGWIITKANTDTNHVTLVQFIQRKAWTVEKIAGDAGKKEEQKKWKQGGKSFFFSSFYRFFNNHFTLTSGTSNGTQGNLI